MRSISASEARKSFASVLEDAVREPIVIRRHERDVAVVLSMHDYERLTAVNRIEFQRFCDVVGQRAVEKGMNEQVLADLLGTESEPAGRD